MSDKLSPWREAAAHPEAYRKGLESRDKKVGAFLEIRPEAAAAASTKGGSALAGLPYAVKNNIAVKGYKLTCGSKMLTDVVSPYSATAVRKLAEAGALVAGTTNLDEFGMGSSTDNSALQKTNNPWDLSRVPGGSSGGSAAAVAANEVAFAIGTDTGGSVRQPAAFCGVYGLKPTYGAISRYGLVAYASSLEVVGCLSKDIDLIETSFNCMKGKDEFDQTSIDYLPPAAKPVQTVAVLKGLKGLSPEVESVYQASLKEMQKLGYKVVEVELPTLEYAVPAYYTIAAAEASANLARYNGIRYGLRPYYAENPEELIRKSRTEGFGDEVKLRVMLGTFVLRSGFQDQFYTRAQKIRTAIRNDLDRIFSVADVLLTPAFPTPAFTHGDTSMDAFAQKQADKFTVTANLAGIPGLSFPAGMAKTNGVNLPVGLLVSAPPCAEARLFEFARKFATYFPVPDCPEYPGIPGLASEGGAK
jgi:aspartyl-tRNA(Asn)/glutamyl-tRNA(Gln) amidotransferase subunit A